MFRVLNFVVCPILGVPKTFALAIRTAKLIHKDCKQVWRLNSVWINFAMLAMPPSCSDRQMDPAGKRARACGVAAVLLIPGIALRIASNEAHGAESSRRQCGRMIMKSSFGIRLWILIAALFLVAGGTIYGLSSAWHRVQQLEAKLTSSQIERFQLASEVRRELQSLNNSILRYALVRDPQQWAQFEQASSDLIID